MSKYVFSDSDGNKYSLKDLKAKFGISLGTAVEYHRAGITDINEAEEKYKYNVATCKSRLIGTRATAKRPARKTDTPRGDIGDFKEFYDEFLNPKNKSAKYSELSSSELRNLGMITLSRSLEDLVLLNKRANGAVTLDKEFRAEVIEYIEESKNIFMVMDKFKISGKTAYKILTDHLKSLYE